MLLEGRQLFFGAPCEAVHPHKEVGQPCQQKTTFLLMTTPRVPAHACAQVTVLSEGRQLFFGAPCEAVPWFGGALGYAHSPARDGAVSDWLMDLVSIAFNKPGDCAARLVVKTYFSICYCRQASVQLTQIMERSARHSSCNMASKLVLPGEQLLYCCNMPFALFTWMGSLVAHEALAEGALMYCARKLADGDGV